MKKILAGLLSLMMLSVSAMQVSAIEYAENGKVIGDICMVVGYYVDDYGDGRSYEYCYLNNGCVISPNVAGDDITLKPGDVIWILPEYGIDPIIPGRYAGIKEIEYLGTAEEYYGSTKELTITEVDDDSIDMVDDQGEEYHFWWSIPDVGEYKYDLYPSDFHVGDKAVFVIDNKDYAVFPLEFTYKAEPEEPSVNINPVPAEIITGDANGDTELDILDVIVINKAVLGKEQLTDTQTKAADVNGDGVIDANDSLILMKYIVGLIDNFDIES